MLRTRNDHSIFNDIESKDHGMGENLEKEWDAEPQASNLLDALELGPSDPETALKKLQELAENGSSLSMFYLGEWHVYGRHGLERDFTVAENWLIRAASQDSIEGSWLLARHLEGAGKHVEAETEYHKLAKLGYSPALFALGYEIYKGNWLERDLPKAIEYLEKAEQLGHFRASHWLWHILIKENLGVKQKIRGWIKKCMVLIPYALCRVNYPNSDRLRW